jgi:hypothetical protein
MTQTWETVSLMDILKRSHIPVAASRVRRA